MKLYKSSQIRNFAILGHGSSGKTSLSESILKIGGKVTRLGTIENGSTVSDYHPGEKARKISIHSTPLHMEWKDKKFNMIDTPGYLDFVGESLAALAVVDMAIILVDINQGVEIGTENMWRHASQLKIPKLIVINGLDKENSNFEKTLEQIKKRFGSNVFPMQLPINPGPSYHQNIDILRSELISYKTDKSGDLTENKLPDEYKEQVDALHQELIEYVAESDDELLEKFFDQGNLSEEEMRHGLHDAIQNQVFIPLFCVSSTSNIGVRRLCDFIAKYGSSPEDRKSVKAEDENGNMVSISLDGKDTTIQIFKTISESHIGELSLFRVYSGTIESGKDYHNTNRKKNERFGQIYALNGKEKTSIDKVNSGDIASVVKLKDTHTGDTLCSNKPIIFPSIKLPIPNIHSAIAPTAKGDEEKLALGLASLHEEDPTFIYRVDSEVKQTIISGQGELHLTVSIERLKRKFGFDIKLEKQRIPYRETITSQGSAKYRHKKQSGGAGQFAEVWLRIEPLKEGAGIEYTHSLVGQNVDRVFVPSVEKGVKIACDEGILSKSKIVDLKVDFYDGKMHPVDSKDIAFQTAGKHAFREAFLSAKPIILEPILEVEIKVPEQYMGDIMSDISSKRGQIAGIDSDGNFQIIKAKVPQAELHHYATIIRSITAGRGIHTEKFSHYEKLPKDLNIND